MQRFLPSVPGKRPAPVSNSNSFRVFDRESEGEVYASVRKHMLTGTDVNILGQTKLHIEPQVRLCPRYNYVIGSNVKTMMAPVRDTRTEGANEDCVCQTSPWWEHPASLLPKMKLHSWTNKDSTMHSDYQYRGTGLIGNTRFGAHPDRSPAVGAAPVNLLPNCDLSKRFWKEGISFEHQYNCRLDPSYPQRGKRRGNYVWTKMRPSERD